MSKKESGVTCWLRSRQITLSTKGNTTMRNDNVFDLTKPEQIDPLQELLRDGARKMLASDSVAILR